MQAVRTVLESLGLNKNEVTVYLALLTVGTSPASVLARRTNLTRSTAQYTCQQLAKKKLVSMVERNSTYIYTCEPPEKLLFLLNLQREELARKEDEVQRIVGSLKRMRNPDSALPKVQFYEGRDGLIELYENILDLHAPIDSFEEKGDLVRLLPDYAARFVEKRIARRIQNRCIAPTGSPLNVTSKAKFIEARLIDRKEYPFTCDIKVCKDQVSIFSFKEDFPVGVAIRHKEIADNFRLIFDQMWKGLEPQRKKPKRS